VIATPNTSTGYKSFNSNTTGTDNTSDGYNTLFSNTTGSRNTASGSQSLFANVTGSDNTALGYGALAAMVSGAQNTAAGGFSLTKNSDGSSNSAFGYGALYQNASGSENIAIGNFAGYFNLGSGNILIGNMGEGNKNENDTIRIGTPGTQTSIFVAGIHGVTSATGTAVLVDKNGQLATQTSSRRFKTDVEDMGAASEVLLSLQPVCFHYKPEIDPEKVPQFGLIAEDVAKVDPNLIVRDNDGQPYSVRYEAVNAMLLNEFLKQHHKMDEQSSTIAAQEKTMKSQETELEEQKATITKLQKQLEAISSQIGDLQAQMKKAGGN